MENTSGQANPAVVPARINYWKWGAIVLACLIALAAAFVFWVSAMLKSSDAYRLGVAQLQASSEAMALLGPPLETGMPLGHIRISGPAGEAQLSIRVEGRKAKGVVHLEATKEMGLWRIDRMVLEVDGERIDLMR